MKIMLINPPSREWSRPNIVPLGLGYIASVLRDSGHEVELMDINAHRWSREEAEEHIKVIAKFRNPVIIDLSYCRRSFARW